MPVLAGATIRCMVRSADVIHSFALPGCILKVDAIPGHLFVLQAKLISYSATYDSRGADHKSWTCEDEEYMNNEN